MPKVKSLSGDDLLKDVSAEYALGTIYLNAEGVPQDYSEAIRWYRKAAEQGSRDAQLALVWMFCRGLRAPLARRWAFAVTLALLVMVLVIPLRYWGRYSSAPNALLSAAFAMIMLREIAGTRRWGLARDIVTALSAGGCALFAAAALSRVSRNQEGSS